MLREFIRVGFLVSKKTVVLRRGRDENGNLVLSDELIKAVKGLES